MTEAKKTRSMLKREAIIEGAIQAFQKFGVGDTSMDKVAETAQVSKRTVYNHFQSKELLVTHIIKHIWRQNLVSYDFPYDPNRDLSSQLSELVANEIKFMNDKKMHELVRVAMSVCLISPEKFAGEIDEFFVQETALMRWLKAAMKDGKLREVEPRMAYEQLLSLLKGFTFWPQIFYQQAPLDEAQSERLRDDTLAFFLSYYEIK